LEKIVDLTEKFGGSSMVVVDMKTGARVSGNVG